MMLGVVIAAVEEDMVIGEVFEATCADQEATVAVFMDSIATVAALFADEFEVLAVIVAGNMVNEV